jgi:GT2 family glycosyltransferase
MHRLSFSVIVPTYRRQAEIERCLEGLAHLSYPKGRFEVIVVDDGSESPPTDVVARFRECLDVMLLKQVHGGPAAARNTGAGRAHGDVLAFTDDDCVPARDWLQALAARLEAAPDCAVGGRTINALPDNPYSSASQLLVSYLYAYYNRVPGQGSFFASNNLAVPADRFRTVGGFDASFRLPAGEDRDFCDRWLEQGCRLCYAPDAIVYHEHKLTLRSFWRQHFRYGQGAFQFREARARRGGGRIRVEPPSFYVGLLRSPFLRADWSGDSLTLSALLLLSQMANAAGFASAWSSRAWRQNSAQQDPPTSSGPCRH